MKTLLVLLLAATLVATTLHAEPKKLLVVTTTTGFRHSSIPTAEKILAQLAQQQRRVHRGFCAAAAGPAEADFQRH